MFNLERRQEIINILEKEKSVSVNKLSRLLYVSQPTVRRDLSILEKQGSVLRTHGGAVLRNASDSELPLIFREDQNNISKKNIARKASGLIKDGDVIFLDDSSTVTYLIPYLKNFKDIIVVTSSPKTSIKLGEENIKNYCTGGLLLRHSVTYVGTQAERFIADINADLCFFSSRGYVENGSITDSSIEVVAVKKAMINNAERAFYLCDSSKKNQKYMYNICHTSDVTAIIDELSE